MDRKSFLQKASATLLVGIPFLSLWGCGDDVDDGSGAPPSNSDTDCVANGTNSAIQSNHGHSLTVSASDVNAGAEKTYDITGGAGHSHQVTVTSGNFTTLKSNQSITVTSTTTGHTHSVTISCA